MKVDLLIKNGTIVTTTGRYKGNIGVTNGIISHLLSTDIDIDSNEVIDAKGKYIIPGAIDAHVHFEDPGRPDREDFAHGTAACAVGGITTPLIMPTNNPLILDLESLKVNLDSWDNKAYVDYGVHGGLDASSIGNVKELWLKSGVTAIKVFMCYSSPNMGFVNDQTLFEALEIMHDIGGFMIIHAENDEIIKLCERRIHDANRTDYMSFNESRPGFGEVEAIRRAIFFIKQTGASAIFPHISTAEGLIEVKKAKDEGVNVFAESCPQYFTFTNEDLKKQGPYLKFSPTMHDEANKEKMWELIAKGYVDTIGSDHSPYAPEEKEAGLENIWKSPNGVPGIESELATFLNGVNEGKIELEDVVRMTSFNPSKIYNVPNKGRIEIGYDADLVVVDMDLEKEFSVKDVKSKCKWSPYFGRKYKGWPVMTLVRGTVVAKDGELMVEEGFGKLVSRNK